MVEETETRRVIPAEEILDKIQNGVPVEYENVIIKGDLDLGKLGLSTKYIDLTEAEISLGVSDAIKIIASPMMIKGSIIDGALNFSNTLFQEYVNFMEAQFNGDANFSGAEFSGDD